MLKSNNKLNLTVFTFHLQELFFVSFNALTAFEKKLSQMINFIFFMYISHTFIKSYAVNYNSLGIHINIISLE